MGAGATGRCRRTVAGADFHLSFADAAQLLVELTPTRLLEALKATGPVTIYALAKHLKRNYSNVHQDVARLVEHGLASKDKSGRIFVPWAEIQIRLTLHDAA